MIFEKNISQIFDINRKSHAVIQSCRTLDQLEGAARYVEIVENFYSHIECTDKLQANYLKKSLENIKSVLKIQKKKIAIY
jgi:hypothetical protein